MFEDVFLSQIDVLRILASVAIGLLLTAITTQMPIFKDQRKLAIGLSFTVALIVLIGLPGDLLVSFAAGYGYFAYGLLYLMLFAGLLSLLFAMREGTGGVWAVFLGSLLVLLIVWFVRGVLEDSGAWIVSVHEFGVSFDVIEFILLVVVFFTGFNAFSRLLFPDRSRN
jgi:formate/nitrite transporter FocA (FNT family)